MAEENAKLNIECGSYKIYELAEEFKKAVDKINELNKGTQTLHDIIKDSGREKELSETFLKELLESIEQNNSQKEIFEKRLAYAKYIIDTINKQDDVAVLFERAVTLTLYVLGVPLSETEECCEEPQENKE